MTKTLAELMLGAAYAVVILLFGIFAALLAIWVELRRKP
jgi:hypothetical protein